jgi:hypothetical protein
MEAQSMHDGGKQQGKMPVPASVVREVAKPGKPILDETGLFGFVPTDPSKALPSNHKANAGEPARTTTVQGKMAPPRSTKWHGTLAQQDEES